MKAYVKPELIFESFVLSQNIAACGWDLLQENTNTCGAYWDDGLNRKPGKNEDGKSWEDLGYSNEIVLFVTANNTCNVKVDQGQYEGYCYTNGTDAMKAFQS